MLDTITDFLTQGVEGAFLGGLYAFYGWQKSKNDPKSPSDINVLKALSAIGTGVVVGFIGRAVLKVDYAQAHELVGLFVSTAAIETFLKYLKAKVLS